MKNTTIETERLVLRPIYESDLDDVFEYSKEENVGPNAGWPPHKTKEETFAIMQEIFIEKENIFGIVRKDTNKLIGSVGLVKDPKRVNKKALMIGYAIGSKHWGNGFMTEACNGLLQYAFDILNVSLISAYCYPFNKRSQRVIEKLGLSYEGMLLQAEELYNGEIADNLCYSLLKENFKPKKV